MDDYTPSTDEVRGQYIFDDYSPDPAAAFDRWLESVEAAAEQRGAEKERERIARNMDAEQRRARAAHQSAPTDHFAHDYCRWVGHAEAFGTAARIAEEGA